MSIKRQWIVTLICSVALLANGASALAQEGKKKEGKHNVFTHSEGNVAFGEWAQNEGAHFEFDVQATDNNVVFVSSEIGGKAVKGAPYSAEAVTEHIQTLADGNRIIRRSSALLYRDSEGRTRREQSVRIVGTGVHVESGDGSPIVFINDPVAETNYVLDPQKRTARRSPAGLAKVRLEEKLRAAKEKQEAVVVGKIDMDSEKQAKELKTKLQAIEAEHAARAGHVEKLDVIATDGGNVSVRTSGKMKAAKNARTESLGKQMFDGVEAEGTRAIITIPAGEIGNDLPIEIINERWYSAELQTHVMTRHSDPRSGENIYRLTNINRNEPVRSLFEVPADYTVEEAKGGAFGTFTVKRDRKRENQ